MDTSLLIVASVLVAFAGHTVADPAPAVPAVLSISNVAQKGKGLIINWQVSDKGKGAKDLYIVIKPLAPMYYVPPECAKAQSSYVTLYSYSETSYTSEEPVEPVTEYEISIKVKVNNVWSTPAMRRYTTEDGSLEPVEDLKCKLATNGAKVLTLAVDWKTPCKANSKTVTYTLELCPLEKDKVIAKSCTKNSGQLAHAARSKWSSTTVKTGIKYELRVSPVITNKKSPAAVTCRVPLPPANLKRKHKGK